MSRVVLISNRTQESKTQQRNKTKTVDYFRHYLKAALFDIFAPGKEEIGIEEYSFSQSTLEQVMFALYLFRVPVTKNVKVSFTVLLPPYPPLPSLFIFLYEKKDCKSSWALKDLPQNFHFVYFSGLSRVCERTR